MANPEEIELAEENVQKDEEDTPKKLSSTSGDNNDPELSEEIDLDVSDNLLLIRVHCCCAIYGSVVISVFCLLMFSIAYFLLRQ